MFPGLSLLDSKWLYIGILVAVVAAGGVFILHEYNHALQMEQAARDALAMQKQQTIKANENTKAMETAYNNLQQQSDAQLASQHQEVVNAQKQDAALTIQLSHARRNIGAINKRLRAAIEGTARRHFSNQEVQAYRASSGPAVLGVSALGAKRIIENQQACEAYVNATQGH